MSAHKTDKNFPGLSASDLLERIAWALREDTKGLSCPEKLIAKVGGVHPKTARYWLDKRFLPQSWSMARLVSYFETVREVWNEATGQEPELDRQRLDAIKALLMERDHA